jgi:plastocyanin
MRTLRHATALAAGLVLCAAGAAFAGTVSGTVVYEGSVPNLRPLSMDADPACAAKHSTPVKPEMLVLGSGNALGNVFVRVTKGVPAKPYPAPSTPVVIDQNGCLYSPHVVGVMVGQPLKFKNSDGILHNVHGLPKANREFNLGMPATLKEKDTTFSKPELFFPVKCDVHPWMNAYVAVMEHPFFDVTGPDGAFSIADLPDGSYELEAWHEKLGTRTATVAVAGGKAAPVRFTMSVPKN